MLTYSEFKEKSPNVDITEGLFLSLQRRIRRRIDCLTFERISDGDKTLQKRIDDVTQDIINTLYFNSRELLNNIEGNSSQNIKSESVGQYKVEYAQANSISVNEKDRFTKNVIDEMIREAFIHTGLMYRGIDDN
ncbi:hypothetical protein [Anaerococcus tetradius]|uniref:Uncharacterized protein n=1 Tax=Anaerococcus tetradius ATCC 35098 TaxID=525255 RepID=C2CFX3_9FIRM|nr:hypothetical protein [Anaerococcus tetradius]EEI83501.1 hypothetical protein HMPREF0077_0383 [Anaerococcus tetradius ATCC 35098]